MNWTFYLLLNEYSCKPEYDQIQCFPVFSHFLPLYGRGGSLVLWAGLPPNKLDASRLGTAHASACKIRLLELGFRKNVFDAASHLLQLHEALGLLGLHATILMQPAV